MLYSEISVFLDLLVLSIHCTGTLTMHQSKQENWQNDNFGHNKMCKVKISFSLTMRYMAPAGITGLSPGTVEKTE